MKSEVHHDAASSVLIVFDTDNRIFGLPRELVVTVSGNERFSVLVLEVKTSSAVTL